MVDDELGDEILPFIYWGLFTNPRTGNPLYKPTRKKWNDRGILLLKSVISVVSLVLNGISRPHPLAAVHLRFVG